MFLADTNIISVASPSSKAAPVHLVAWMDSVGQAGRLYLSAVTAAEVRAGVAKLQRKGATRKAAVLLDWWSAIEHLYADRILPFDLKAAHHAAVMADRALAAGIEPGFADVAIGSTAEAHGLVCLTRNARHFAPMGGRWLDPYTDPLPEVV
ncbi:PIN domain-containing protein [Aureimonas mangrovi]|uniref:PIN domain-containing protein n=1 Tax=Aureimonas mangrovi TaxID=2758041 RepID=UPI00163D47EA|nr:PIN domain-containing protein [Aureimonas mangrovi]